ncbi:PAS domain-containing protein [Rubripirellula reticaptiva]|uniref:histidine kinase n=1 Tax=Rubripirellula reticaptiva TaxID=2528013 RepID=A0A5C6F8B5_9BACT|nr:PAS domain-containing protein [Rubripirellula reticaptiva]TWU57993.1 Blue-light-activated protein [Rubripirellula reticaptiva]
MSEDAKLQVNQQLASEVVRHDSDSGHDSDASPFDSESTLMQQLKLHQIELEQQNAELRRAVADVNDQCAKYFKLYDQAPVGCCTVNRLGTVVEANHTLLSLLGTVRDELIEASLAQFIHPEDQDDFHQMHNELHSMIQVAQEDGVEGDIEVDRSHLNPVATSCEVRMLQSDGGCFWAHFFALVPSSKQESSSAGQQSAVQISIAKVDSRRNPLSQLKGSEQHLKESQSIAQIGSFHWNSQTNEVFWSDEAYRIFGQLPGEFQPSFDSYIAAIHPSDKSFVLDSLNHAIDTLGAFDHVYRAILPNGTQRWFNARGWATLGPNGELAGLDGTCQDITESKIETEAKQEALGRLEKIASHLPGFVYQYRLRPDGSSCLPYASENLRQIFRLDPEDVVDASAMDGIIHPDDRDGFREAVEKSARDLTRFNHEFRLEFSDGEIKWLSINSFPEREPDGSILWHGYAADVSERKNAEFNLYRSKQDLNEAQRIARMGSWHLNLETNEVQWSDEVYRVFGLDPALPAPTVDEQKQLFVEDSWAKMNAAVENTTRTGVAYEVELEILRIGQYRGWMWARGEVVKDPSGRTIGLRGVAQDITRRKRAEVELQQSETLLRIVTGSARVGLVVLSAERRYSFANETYAAILGRPSASIVGHLVADVLPEIYEELIRPQMDRAFAGESVDYEVRVPKGSGEAIVTLYYQPVFEGNVVSRVVAVLVDVTEIRSIEEQLRQAQKMEAVGQLAGGIAHDFNNLLTVIIGYTDLMLRNPATDLSTSNFLREIEKASEHASDLTRSLLAYSRRQVRTPEKLDLNEVILNSLSLLRSLVGDGVEVELKLEPNLRRVWIDQSEMSQMLLNISINARDAMDHMGKLEIETRNVDITADDSIEAGGARPGKYVQLSVSDVGCGISEEIQQRIFEPFFTTKPVGKGSGLGLSMVQGIISESGGVIQVTSRVGEGTTFKILLPEMLGTLALFKNSPSNQDPVGGDETILLVEDDDSVRLLTMNILGNYGYDVIPARNAQEAIDILDQQPDRIQALMTDLVMPGMNGFDLSEYIQAAIPGLPMLFMSGFVGEIARRELMNDENFTFLQKPFTPRDLAAKLRETLDRRIASKR